MAIVDWDGVPTMTEFYLIQKYLGRHGIKVVIYALGNWTLSTARCTPRAYPWILSTNGC